MKFVIRFGIFAAVLAVVILFINGTEWVETEVRVPPRGEAARDRYYAMRHLLPRLGMQVVSRTGLDTLPPAGARLLLTSNDWALFKSRPRQLEQWVRAGGQLVVPAVLADRSNFGWLPIELHDRPRPKPGTPPVTPPRPIDPLEYGCRTVNAPDGDLHICASPHWRDIAARDGVQAAWQVRSTAGVEAMRAPLGQGTVTVVGPTLFGNNELLRADNPLFAVQALQADRGAVVWIVSEESRQKLLAWVWSEAWFAAVAALLALGAGLWRSSVRFGPLLAARTRERRSISEQVTGTAHFLLRHGQRALHEAERRALDETAARYIPGYRQADAGRRAALIAASTGLAQAELSNAMRFGSRPVAPMLSLMETARRRIKENHADQD